MGPVHHWFNVFRGIETVVDKVKILVAANDQMAQIRVIGRATFACSSALRNYGLEQIAAGIERMVIDLSACAAMDSTFMGHLAALGLRGRSEMISLVEFVGFLSSLNRDGVLQVQAAGEEFVLQFDQGALVFAAGSNPPELRLGEILVANEVVSRDELESALERAHPDEFKGETLTRLGVVDQDELQDALMHQITQMFCRMHLVGAGFDFQFEEGTKVFFAPDIQLNVPHLLLESARLNDQGDVATTSVLPASS